MRLVAAFLLAILAVSAHASGWHDYTLEIAPGYSVEHLNSLEVCISGPGRELLVCPTGESPTFGPLVNYAVTDDAIISRHYGAKRDDRNSEIWDVDPSTELYFYIRRADRGVLGPYSRSHWNEIKLPDLDSLPWTEPHNPNFWTPLMGTAFFLLMTAYYLVWPLVLAALLLAGLVLWLIRRRSRRNETAA